MNTKKIKKELKKSKFQCRIGFFIWHQLIRKHPEIKNTAVILLPACKETDNFYALLYLDQFLKKMKRENAVILTHDPKVLNSASNFSKNVTSIIFFNRKKAEMLMKYASLYEFDNRLVIASLDEPKGRNGSCLIGLKGLTEEEIFAIGVYHLFPFKREKECT